MNSNWGSSRRFSAIVLTIAIVTLASGVWLWLQLSQIPVIEATSRPGYQNEAEYKAFSSADRDTEVHLPFVNKDPAWDWETTIVVQNTNAIRASVTLHYRNLAGAETSTVIDSLPAYAVRSYKPEESFSGSVMINASEPVVAIVNERSIDAGWKGDRLMSYRGTAASAAANDIIVAPIYRQFSNFSSWFGVQNIGPSADISVTYFDMTGTLVHSQTITVPADSAHYYNVDDIAALGTNYVGIAQIQGDNPVAVMYHVINEASGGAAAYSGQPVFDGTQYLPQVSNSSAIMLYNMGTMGATYLAALYPQSENAPYTTSDLIAPGTVSTLLVNSIPGVPADFQGSAIIVADPLVVALVYNEWEASSPTTATGYGAVNANEADTSFYVPYVRKSFDGYVTAINVQNVGSSSDDVTVTYYNQDGSSAGSETEQISPNRAHAFDQAISSLPAAFSGSAIVTSDAPIAVTGFISQQDSSCVPVSDVHIQRTPAGDVFTGDTLLFTTSASGDIPFSTSWTLDSSTIDLNRSTIQYTFDTSGDHTVGVTVTNDCGQASESAIVPVQQPDGQIPDLATSIKTVNLASAESGDLLDYMLTLRNSSEVNAAVTLTETVPSTTNYMVDSAQASDGSAVTVSSGDLQWSGQVISGTPVLIIFSAEVAADLDAGTPITNVAQLDDGLGNIRLLQADSIYNPGYLLSIDDGVLYTGDPTVKLRYSWNDTDNISHVKFSNDGGFGAAGDTTDWLSVDEADPTYSNWLLSTYSDLVLPRTVYAMFRDGTGAQFGPVRDDIFYDPNAPQINRVELIPVGGLQLATLKATIVRVIASDGNSGVSAVQISHSISFDEFSGYPVTGNPTDIAWLLQPSGKVYVRVMDRAGNMSEVSTESGPANYDIYLPNVLTK